MDTTQKRTPMAAVKDARQNDFYEQITAEDVKKAREDKKLVVDALVAALEFKRIADHMFADPKFAQSAGGRKYLKHYQSLSNRHRVLRAAFGDKLVPNIPGLDDRQLHNCHSSRCKLPSCVEASPKGSGQKNAAVAKKSKKEATMIETIEIEEGAAESLITVTTSTEKQVAGNLGESSQAGDKSACSTSTSTIEDNVAQQNLDNNNKAVEASKVDASSASMQKSPGETSGQTGPSAEAAEVFDCRVKDCSLQFNTFEEAVKHYESHENDNIIKCSRCDVMYLSRELMFRHFFDVHNVVSEEVLESSSIE